jgi:catechol 2,3-dioxygenase-like lactoylglutathione lyase family enzyme
METTPKMHSTVPVIATADIEKSLEYYTTVFGFEFDFKYGEPLVYAGVRYGEAEIYFSYDPVLAAAISSESLNPEIFIWVPDGDAIFEQHRLNGADIIELISDRPWGSRQYVIRNINGYLLKFAQPL